MGKHILLFKKLKMKEQERNECSEKIEALKIRETEVLNTVDDIEEEDKLNDVEKELDDIQSQISDLEKEKEDIESEIESLQKQADELAAKTPKNEERKGVKHMETRKQIESFIRSKGEQREGLKLVDGGVLIPTETLKPQVTKTREVDLLDFVDELPVSTGSGQYPIITKSGKKLVAVSELEKNPELAKPNVKKVDFSIETYRGYLSVSQEMLDDADYDVMSLVETDGLEQERNTKIAEVAAVLKTATPKDATGLDGLKDILNTVISSVYNKVLVVSDSLYNALDKVKDTTGRYQLQPDPTSPTGMSFSGRPIVTVPDDVIAERQGELKGFIGDVKEFLKLFNRKQLTAKWTDNNIYGELLGVFTRFDVKKTDVAAGVYVTFTPEG